MSIIKANSIQIPLKDESVHRGNQFPRDAKGRFINGFKYHPSTQFKKGEHWRQHKAHWDKEWLYQKYVADKMSSEEIAELQGCTDDNILFWLRKHGIPARTVSEVRKIKHWGSPGEKNAMFGIRGSLHPNWQGGLTPFRQKMYNTEVAKEWFRYIYVRDERKCKICSSKTKTDVHHILPIRKYPLLIFDKNNGIVLCQECHKKMKGKELRYAKKLFSLIQGGTKK